jgi:hypothetical protein
MESNEASDPRFTAWFASSSAAAFRVIKWRMELSNDAHPVDGTRF